MKLTLLQLQLIQDIVLVRIDRVKEFISSHTVEEVKRICNFLLFYTYENQQHKIVTTLQRTVFELVKNTISRHRPVVQREAMLVLLQPYVDESFESRRLTTDQLMFFHAIRNTSGKHIALIESWIHSHTREEIAMVCNQLDTSLTIENRPSQFSIYSAIIGGFHYEYNYHIFSLLLPYCSKETATMTGGFFEQCIRNKQHPLFSILLQSDIDFIQELLHKTDSDGNTIVHDLLPHPQSVLFLSSIIQSTHSELLYRMNKHNVSPLMQVLDLIQKTKAMASGKDRTEKRKQLDDTLELLVRNANEEVVLACGTIDGNVKNPIVTLLHDIPNHPALHYLCTTFPNLLLYRLPQYNDQTFLHIACRLFIQSVPLFEAYDSEAPEIRQFEMMLQLHPETSIRDRDGITVDDMIRERFSWEEKDEFGHVTGPFFDTCEDVVDCHMHPQGTSYIEHYVDITSRDIKPSTAWNPRLKNSRLRSFVHRDVARRMNSAKKKSYLDRMEEYVRKKFHFPTGKKKSRKKTYKKM